MLLYTYVHAYNYIGGEITKLLSLHPLLFTKDTLLAKVLMLSTVNMYDVHEHLGICTDVSMTAGSDSTLPGMI